MNGSYHKILLLIVLNAFLIIPKMQAQKISLLNSGVSGNITEDLLSRIRPDVIDIHPDIVIIMIGTNDMLNAKKMIPYNAYRNNLNLIVRSLKENHIKVVLVSPPPVDVNYLYKRHDKKLYDQTPDTKMDSISRIMEFLCKDDSAYFINVNTLFKRKGIPDHNKDLYIKNKMNSGEEDGVHPTAKGYQLIAKYIFKCLQKEKLLTKDGTILCFGDSITFGKNVRGEGTATGQTYPAYLADLIKNHKDN